MGPTTSGGRKLGIALWGVDIFFFFFLSREYHVLAWMLRRPANVHKPMGLSTWKTARVERRNDAAYSQIQSSDNIGIEPMLSRAHEMDIPPFLKN